MVFYFFSGVKSPAEPAQYGVCGTPGVVGVRSESIEKFLKIAFIRENVYASQVECVVVKGDDRDQVTAWRREDEAPLP